MTHEFSSWTISVFVTENSDMGSTSRAVSVLQRKNTERVVLHAEQDMSKRPAPPTAAGGAADAGVRRSVVVRFMFVSCTGERPLGRVYHLTGASAM